MERKKFTFIVHMLSCISVPSTNASSFKHVLLLALSCNELNYSLITTLEKGCVQILIAGTCSPPSWSASSARLVRRGVGGGRWTLNLAAFPSSSPKDTLPCNVAHTPGSPKDKHAVCWEALMPPVLPSCVGRNRVRYTSICNEKWALIQKQTKRHLFT